VYSTRKECITLGELGQSGLLKHRYPCLLSWFYSSDYCFISAILLLEQYAGKSGVKSLRNETFPAGFSTPKFKEFEAESSFWLQWGLVLGDHGSSFV